MDKTKRILFWIVGIIIILLLINNPFKKEANLLSSQVQYYNKPITFSVSNVSLDSNVAVSFEGNNINFTKQIVNNTLLISTNVMSTGTVTASIYGTATETVFIEAKKPYLDVKTDFPINLDLNTAYPLKINTFNPQGEKVAADTIDMDITLPDYSKDTVLLAKTGENEYTYNYTFKQSGGYFFDIHARIIGWDVNEKRVAVQVLKPAGIHPIIYIWLGTIVVWLILFIIKRFRK